MNILPMRLLGISDGPAGIKETLDYMSGFVRAGKKIPLIRTLAMSIAKQIPGKLWVEEIQEIFLYVQRNIRYIQDISDVETLATPTATLEMGQGDCDDMCVLLCALLESIGYHTRFVACGFEDAVFEHVFVQVQLPNKAKWISLDPSENVPMGWQPPGIVCAMPKDN
jgi:transglutaminase-like putative cysteine protease